MNPQVELAVAGTIFTNGLCVFTETAINSMNTSDPKFISSCVIFIMTTMMAVHLKRHALNK